MGLFSFGSSKSSSSSQSSGFNFGQSFVDPGQQPSLDFIRNAGMDLFNQQQPGLQGLFGQAEQLGQQGQGFLGQLTDNPFLSALQGQAGGNPRVCTIPPARADHGDMG